MTEPHFAIKRLENWGRFMFNGGPGNLPEDKNKDSVWSGIRFTFGTIFVSFALSAIAGFGILMSQTENGNLRKAYYYSNSFLSILFDEDNVPAIGKVYQVCEQRPSSPNQICLNSSMDEWFNSQKLHWALGNPNWNPTANPNEKAFIRFYWSKEKPGYLIICRSVSVK